MAEQQIRMTFVLDYRHRIQTKIPSRYSLFSQFATESEFTIGCDLHYSWCIPFTAVRIDDISPGNITRRFCPVTSTGLNDKQLKPQFFCLTHMENLNFNRRRYGRCHGLLVVT